MKKLLLKSMLLLCALVVGSMNGWAQDNKSSVYTSNVTLSAEGGTRATASTVVINSTNYSAIKLGTNGNSGLFKATFPTGTKYIHFHVAAWNGKNGNTLSFSGISDYTPSGSITLTANSGVSGGSSTYTFGTTNADSEPNTANHYKVLTLSTALTADTEITFTCSERCVIWGVNSEDTSGSSLANSDLALTDAPIALDFDLFNNSNAQEISYTTSSTGAVTVSGGTGYVTTAVNTGTKKITVTPTGQTPDANEGYVTITVNQAADNNYKAGSKTFTVKVANSDPDKAGTANTPYTVAQARSAINNGVGITGVYATGIVSEIVTAYSSENHNISFNISTDGLTTSEQLQAYRCKKGEGVSDPEVSDIQVGDIVIVTGNLTKFNSTYEFAQNNTLVSVEHKVATPTFSIEAGEVVEGSTVSINCATAGATIYYTTNGSEPTTGSTEYEGPITVNAAMTIKAIGAKAGSSNSDVATAAYTVRNKINGLTIDFEASNVDQYADWEFNNIGNRSGIDGVTAHGGSKWGSNVNSSGNGVTTAYIKTKNKIANPSTFTCFISKESANETASTWTVQYSSDGTNWTDAGSQDAVAMEKGVWNKFTANLSGNHDVYVRLSYSSTGTARRAIDDIILTLEPAAPSGDPEVAVTLTTTANMAGWRTYNNNTANKYTVDGTTKVYYASAAGENKVTLEEIAGGVPANTVVILHQTSGNTITLTKDNDATCVAPGSNLLQVSTAGEDLGKVYRLGYKSSHGVGFYTYTTNSAPEGIIYVSSVSTARDFLGFDFGDEATGVNEVKAQKVDGDYYNLAGQRVAQPTKGLYIVNGKKVIMK